MVTGVFVKSEEREGGGGGREENINVRMEGGE